jgi:hypothetical protein
MEDYIIDMTNYSVPFDFDGSRLAWVEFLSDKERNVCIFYLDNSNKWLYQIDKSFGHISHLKLMPNNKVFIVRNLNQCEVRECDKEFKLCHSFKHLGDEVIAVDYYINSSKILLNDMELDNIQISKNNPQYIKIPNEKNKELPEKNIEMNIVEENIHQDSGVNEDNISIYTLDIDGNMNVWENYSMNKMFNLYEMKDINEDYKNKQFFSMGYPYFIKANMNYFAISSDHGVFIIKKGNE